MTSKGYSKLQNAYEAKEPFLEGRNDDKSTENPEGDREKKRSSKNKKIFLTIFILLVVGVTAIVGILLHQKSGSLLCLRCK